MSTRGAGVMLVVLAGSLALGVPAAREKVDETVCLVCHDDLLPALDAKVPHPPAAMGDCSSCHNPHVSRFDALLRDRPGPLCAQCHDEISAALEMSIVHPPVAEGRCGDCHDPHGGDHRALLVEPGSKVCGKCHAEISDLAGRPVQHAPFSEGECGTCHEPHASENAGLLARPGGETCSPCHEVNSQFRAVHRGYPVERADCKQCHDPHASVQEGLFRANTHPPFVAGDCTSCHQAPDGDDPFGLGQRLDQLCGECHDDQVVESREAPFPHVPAGGGECVTCHNPHTSDGPGFLNASEETLCLSCHDPGGAKSGEPGRFLSHGDLACTTCHAPHGGPRPVLLQAGSIELCGTCHGHQHTVAHPMGKDSNDPRTGQPVDCLSCHGIHDAPHPKYLHRAADRDLCLACHKELARRGR